jgi:outer membrane protein OmpA-like peptidoglycan-associated protein
MMTYQRSWMIAGASALASLLASGGCGSAAVSPELVDARRTVQEARNSLAADLEPDELRQAEQLLGQAEHAANGTEREQYLAYLADRRARVAMANARQTHVAHQMDEAEARYHRDLESVTIARIDRLRATRHELEDVRSELAERGDLVDARTRQLQARERELAEREAQLTAEREARLEAEQRAAGAMARLAELAQIRDEADETIITLSGEVLFETGRAEVRPTARQRLQAVADALATQPDRRIRIEGHTDSRGSDDDNMELSRERARAVRQFMVDRGIEASRVEAAGRGETEPIADNRSPEGRANNRRVEIVLGPIPSQPRTASAPPTTEMGSSEQTPSTEEGAP